MDQLTTFFQLYAPSKLANVAAIRAKYAGREAQLFAFLRRKYAAEIAALDFRSAQFDAAAALRHAHVQPPRPSARLLDNLAKCRSLLSPSSPHYSAPRAPKPKPAAEAAARLPQKAAAAPERRRGLIGMLAHYAAEKGGRETGPGPLAMLGACLKRGARVRVRIRRINGVRGHCDGKIKAFDRHFNMILLDADEMFEQVETSSPSSSSGRRSESQLGRVGRGGSGGVGSSGGSSSRRVGRSNSSTTRSRRREPKRGAVVRELSGDRVVRRVTRHIGQVFIRGDNVVLVHALQSNCKS